eukprot:Phypoly_transcript_07767.p1 GENE.Phypoly_transcript_07767~~Phypoly_transcript_07767.p1  ORF type:complete len:499 (-),score=131.28 Phypoly_transcript_07767:23-1519(-)
MAGRLASLLKAGQGERISVIKLFLDKGEHSLSKKEAHEIYSFAASKSLLNDLTVFQSYLTYHSRRGNVEEVKEGLKVLAPRHKFAVTRSWNAFLIEAHTQRGEFVTAQNILRHLSHRDREQLDAAQENSGAARVYEQLYINLILAMAESGRLAPALALFERMKQRGVTPSADAYDVAITLCLRAQDEYMASEFLKEMRKERVTPHVQTITKLLNLKSSLQRVHECFEIFDECKKFGPFPDLAIYSAMIYGLNFMLKYDEAIRMFGDLHENMRAPRELYNCVISACGKTKQKYKTRKIWDKMVAEIGSENLTEQDYANYMAAIANTGDLEEALRVLDVMHAANLPRTQHTAYAMMTIAANSPNLEMARAQFESLRKNGYLTQTTTPWNEMMVALIRGGDPRGARALFDEMRTSAQPYPDTHSFNIMLKQVQIDEIMGIFKEMKEKKVFPDTKTYHTVAMRLGRTGHENIAFGIIKEMRDAGFVITKGLFEIMNKNSTVT